MRVRDISGVFRCCMCIAWKAIALNPAPTIAAGRG
jgi:hypothetical protein